MPTCESLLLIWACNPQMFIDGVGGTLDCFWKVVQWSFTILFSGKWPSHDHRGVRYPKGSPEERKSGTWLAGGFYCIVLSLCGDLDYNNKFLNLPHWSNAKRPYNLYRYTSLGPTTWKDYRAIAPWRSTCFTTPSWHADTERSTCPIFNTPNISGLTVQPDWMHIKYLGFMQFFLGSVLYILTHTIMPSSPLQNSRRIGLIVSRLQRRWQESARIPVRVWSKLTTFMKEKRVPKNER